MSVFPTIRCIQASLGQDKCLPRAIGFPGGSVVKKPPANAGDWGDAVLIPGPGRSPGVGSGNPLQYSCLENPMDRGAWQATVHGVAACQNSWAHIHACTHWLLSSLGLFLNPGIHHQDPWCWPLGWQLWNMLAGASYQRVLGGHRPHSISVAAVSSHTRLSFRRGHICGRKNWNILHLGRKFGAKSWCFPSAWQWKSLRVNTRFCDLSQKQEGTPLYQNKNEAVVRLEFC